MNDSLSLQNLSNDLASGIRGYMSATEIYQKNILITYIAYKLNLSKHNVIPSTMNEMAMIIEDEQIRQFALSKLEIADINTISELCKYELSVLVAFIVKSEVPLDRMGPETITPQGIIKLALALLQVNDSDLVLDACSGFGNFLVESMETTPYAKYTGIEVNHELAMISKIRFEVLGISTELLEADLLSSEFDDHKFSKIFSNYPFGTQAKLISDSSFCRRAYSVVPALAKASNSDWLFNYRIVNLLKDGGRAVAIMAMGGLWNTRDKQIRKYFVESGLIEAIIALPSRLFTSTNANTAMIVFGRNNGSIKMIDARDNFTDNRRMNILTDADVKKIELACRFRSSFSKDVAVENIAYNDYSLDPQKYLAVKETMINGVEFGTLISSITRGAPITANELDSLATSEDTKAYYLALANIKDGMIGQNLPMIKEIDKKYEKYCIKDGDILLSKNGYPFKVAVAEIKGDEKILATGNLFVISVDRTKANPYYIKAFLDSTAGIEELKSITVGSTIPTIGVSQLNTILIPKIPLEKQEEIANRYVAILGEIEQLQVAVEAKKAELSTILGY